MINFHPNHTLFSPCCELYSDCDFARAYATNRINQHLSRLSIKNRELKKEAEKQVAWTDRFMRNSYKTK